MKTLIVTFFLAFGITSATDTDSVARAIAQIINAERRAQGIDTMEYQVDSLGFATDWADSTNRFFNMEGNAFTRDLAHRGWETRFPNYEKLRGKEWKYFSECVGSGFKKPTIDETIKRYGHGILNSKDHYEVLMNGGYKNIIIGVCMKRSFFSMVIFVTTEHDE